MVWHVPVNDVACVTEIEPEGRASILLGAFVLVCDKGQDQLRQIKACKPDKNREPVIITQVGHGAHASTSQDNHKLPYRKRSQSDGYLYIEQLFSLRCMSCWRLDGPQDTKRANYLYDIHGIRFARYVDLCSPPHDCVLRAILIT